MKTKEQIQELIIFLKGYIAGQSDSFSPDNDEIRKAEIRLNAFEEILEVEKINEHINNKSTK